MRPSHRLLAAALLCLGFDAAAGERTAHERKARELFAKAISIPTSAGLGKVPELAEYLAGELRAGGFPAADVQVLRLGETASLVARYRGDGSGGRPILLLSHLDVVTAKREDWQRDPYTLVEENGFFYGRGTLDVKQSVAGLTAVFLRLKAEGFLPTRDLILYFSGDEETTGEITRHVLQNHRALVDAEYALNSDGGGASVAEDGRVIGYSLQTAEKTYASFELTVRNPGGHSSVPRADNAIYELAALGADPSHAARIRTTCVATMLRGGHAENALPQSATATVNCRIFPGHALDEVTATLRRVAGPQVEVATIGTPFPAPASPLRTDVLEAVTATVHSLYPGVPILPAQSAGASDAIFFRAVGIPTYGTGLSVVKESDEFSHGLDERLPVASFYEDLEYWHRLVRRVAGPAPK